VQSLLGFWQSLAYSQNMETRYPCRVALVLTEHLRDELQRAAFANETSVSQFIRDALRQRLQAERLPPLQERP
jgi:uncharacterized protein (DUF1778 family)